MFERARIFHDIMVKTFRLRGSAGSYLCYDCCGIRGSVVVSSGFLLSFDGYIGRGFTSPQSVIMTMSFRTVSSLSPYFSSCFMVSRPFTTFPKIT